MSGFAVPAFDFVYQGLPASSGKLYVYQTATTTIVPIYLDAALTTPAQNPLTLDANGQAKFYYSGAVNLRFDAYTVNGTLIQSIDPVYPVGAATTGSVILQSINLTLTSNNASNNIIATTAITISLPQTTTLSNSFSVQLNAQGGAITLSPYITDKINQGSAGANFVLAQGTSAQLWTDANGNWGLNFYNGANTIKAFLTIKRKTFTATGTYNPSAGMLYADIEVWGGGGGGGGVGSTNSIAAGGGGAGGYSRILVPASALGAPAVVIGTGGSGGANTGGTGGTGGTTSLGSTVVQATGGLGGVGATAANISVIGGNGGIGTLGDINATGAPGGAATTAATTTSQISGYGGNTSLGGGGKALSNNAGASNGVSGAANSGSGGSGAINGGSTGMSGGVGGSGYVVITEYCSQ